MTDTRLDLLTSADFLNAIRARHLLPSDGKLARFMGWPRTEVSSYRTGRRRFSNKRCVDVARALNVPVSYVLVMILAGRTRVPLLRLECLKASVHVLQHREAFP